MPKVQKEELPGTLRKSPAKAQRTYAETLDSAHEQYGSEERAHRTAYASLKHVSGRSRMSKMELGQAIARRQD